MANVHWTVLITMVHRFPFAKASCSRLTQASDSDKSVHWKRKICFICLPQSQNNSKDLVNLVLQYRGLAGS
jgi:hypothetical protein